MFGSSGPKVKEAIAPPDAFCRVTIIDEVSPPVIAMYPEAS
jgi:hypothetical protein